MGGIIRKGIVLGLGLGISFEAAGAWTMHPAKPPLPGQSESCKEAPPPPDFSSDCENCPDVELVKCDIYLGSDEMENKITFTVKNHNTKYARLSDSARFGHVGVEKAQAAPAENTGNTDATTDISSATGTSSAPVPTPVQKTVSLDIPSKDTPAYKGALDEYPADNAGDTSTESMPDAFTLAPSEVKTFEVTAITDFPSIQRCQDIVYMKVAQHGILETPYLWNRNYPCTVRPCAELAFRQCTMHRGGQGKGATPPPALPPVKANTI